MLGLKWTDLDLEAGTLRNSRSLDTYYGPAQENAPKRQSSRRAAKLPAPIVEAFRRHLEDQQATERRLGPLWKGPTVSEGYVFTTPSAPRSAATISSRAL